MKKLTVLCVCAMVSFAQMWAQNVVISLDKFHFERGEDIVVTYSNGPCNAKDYIGIAPLGQPITGAPGGYTTTYAYLDNPGTAEGICTVPGNNMGASVDGYYWAVYLLDDGYNAGSVYVPFYYGEKAPQNEAPALTVDECTVDYTTITFTDNELWRNLIKGISVDGTELTTDDYTMEAGALYILKDLTAANTLTITAWDHPDATVAFGTTSIDENLVGSMRFCNGHLYVSNIASKSVSVISLTGVMVGTYTLNAGENVLDLTHLNNGVYLVKADGKGAGKVMKIIIRH